jgi:hypothetical protein
MKSAGADLPPTHSRMITLGRTFVSNGAGALYV